MSCHTDTETGIVYVSQLRGDSFLLTVELSDASRSPVDATGWTWRSDLRDAADLEVATIEVGTADASIGVVTMTMPAATTEALDLGDYSWDLESTDLTPEVRTLVTGKLRLRADVTR